MQFVSVLIMAVLAVGQNPKPQSIKGAIKKADNIVKKSRIPEAYWGKGKPSAEVEDQYINVLKLIEQAGVFDRPIKVSVPVQEVVTNENGSVVIRGVFAGHKIVAGLSTAQELAAIQAHDKERKQQRRQNILNNEHLNQEQRLVNDDLDAHRRHDHYYRYNYQHSEYYLRQKKLGQHQQMDRQLNEQRNDRVAARDDRAALSNELYASSAPRLEFLQNVFVTILIPRELAAKMDMAKVASAKRVLFTGKVVDYALRAPLPIVKQPAAIGEMVIEAAMTILKGPDRPIFSPLR